jgi:integrase
VQPAGAKLWRFAYRFGRKQKLLALGTYPLVTLGGARIARDAMKRLLLDGIDPSEARRQQKAEQAATEQTFKLIAAEYVAKLKREGRSSKTLYKNEWLLTFANAEFGDRAVTSIKPVDVLKVLRKLEDREQYHSAHRLRSTIGAVFRLAIATARAEADPTVALRDALVSYKEQRRPAITTEKPFGALLRAMDGYEGQLVTRSALQLMAILFPRPGELRQARWSEFDFGEAIWSVPAERMKGRLPHFVPLPHQAIKLLRELREATENAEIVFPCLGSSRRCISDGTLNAALRRMGYDTERDHCAHGFRSTASTILNESGKFNPDAIERQLAHVDRDEVRGKYARGAYWEERVKMMQWWADLCDRVSENEPRLRLAVG